MRSGLIRFDWAMKKLLRSKANFGILEGFLSELLKKNLKIIRFLESESNRENKDGKSNQVDMLAELETGELVLIEVQVNTESDYFYRMLYGSSKIVTEYLKAGEAYSKIKKVYSVNILYFDLGHGRDYIYHGTTRFVGMHEQDELDLNEKQKELYQKECTYEIYPEYYLIKVNQFNDVAKDTLDEWIYFLKNEEIKDNFRAKGMVEAKDKLTELKLSDKEQQEYKKYLTDLHYQASMAESGYGSGMIDGKKIGVEEGKKIGLEEGKKAGIEEGKKVGIEEGEKIGMEKEKRDLAKKMKSSGMSSRLIQQITGLTIDDI